MCRIFGQFGRRPLSSTLLTSILASQRHGGPDEERIDIGENWFLGNNRLAIQGIAGGSQPFRYQDSIIVVYNGEIYNHRELRRHLEQRGHSFLDDCDGSILPALYLEYGLEGVERLDGMFAIAFIDQRDSPQIHLVADPAGVKSLYYHYTSLGSKNGGVLSFASELTALKIYPDVSPTICPLALDTYLTMRAVCGGRDTIYSEIKTLAPSEVLTLVSGKAPFLRRYQTKVKVEPPSSNLLESAQQLRSLLQNEVQAMLQADVPVCCTTSGGLDSSLITALAARESSLPLVSFHVTSKGSWPFDERAFAEEVARELGTQLITVEADITEFPDILPQLVSHLGQPNAAPHALSTELLFREIRRNGFKVALTGEGADEAFAGYERFKIGYEGADNWIPRYLDLFGPFSDQLRTELYSADYLQLLESRNGRCYSRLAKRLSASNTPAERLRTLLTLDQEERFAEYILRRVDHLSMAHAVEVRVPFCQPRIRSFARQLPVDHLVDASAVKKIVFDAAEGLIPRSILARPKQPFTLPVSAMLQQGTILFDYARELLTSRACRERGLFRPERVEAFFSKSSPLTSSETNGVWALLILELWLLEQQQRQVFRL